MALIKIILNHLFYGKVSAVKRVVKRMAYNYLQMVYYYILNCNYNLGNDSRDKHPCKGLFRGSQKSWLPESSLLALDRIIRNPSYYNNSDYSLVPHRISSSLFLFLFRMKKGNDDDNIIPNSSVISISDNV